MIHLTGVLGIKLCQSNTSSHATLFSIPDALSNSLSVNTFLLVHFNPEQKLLARYTIQDIQGIPFFNLLFKVFTEISPHTFCLYLTQ